MRYLILSDIHSNFSALEACLRHAANQYTRIVCLGDLVGYGPDPNSVVDWVRSAEALAIRGNHDRACSGLVDLRWFNDYAQDVARWTLRHLTTDNCSFLRSLPEGPMPVNGFLAAHGSPADEDEYVLSPVEAGRAFAFAGHLTFIGHTHLQGGFQNKGGRIDAIPPNGPRSERREFPLSPDAAYLINPGAVGQPRDRDPRAAYAIYDSDAGSVSYCRVSYDILTVQERMSRAGFPQPLVGRLGSGR